MVNYYICPRCNYQTKNKPDIIRHFKRKNPCSDENNLILTEEIKKIVCDNHRYHPPPKNELPLQVTNKQMIINYNFLSNLVSQLNMDEKLDFFLDYNDKKLMDIEDGLDKKFEYRVDRLDQDKSSGGYYLKIDDFFNIIDSVTKIEEHNIEQFNIVFDKFLNKIKLYRGKEWSSYLEEAGTKELLSLIKSYFLNTYEIYLIRNLDTNKSNGLNRLILYEHLEIYYRFIAIFDLFPCISDYSDIEIIEFQPIESVTHSLGDKYMKLYFDCKKDIKLSEKNKIIKKVSGIIKDNTKHNLVTLNKAIFEILKVDENFRNSIIESKKINQ